MARPVNAETDQHDELRALRSDYAERYGFHDDRVNVFETQRGLTEEIVREISAIKDEPEWMLAKRLEGLRHFLATPMPNWGGDLTGINFDEITYYVKAAEQAETDWESVPDDIKRTFDRLGVPEAERSALLGGVGAQYDSEVVYHSLKEQWEQQGVLFLSPEEAVQNHPDLVQEHFGKIIPYSDNKFAALNTAVWSGGSFIYVPPGVHVDIPLQAYFRINTANAGQFERTLIIADEGSFVHYVEGCTAPIYSKDSLHSAVVEIVVKRGARVRYSTIQNWSNNVYNLVTKRAVAYADATMEWVDANLGSKLTMKYPAVVMLEPGAHGEVLSIAFAGNGQHQDAGSKMVHAAPNTTSRIISKSISKDGGRSTYRGLCKVYPDCTGVKSNVVCDALLLDEQSRSDTYPYMEVEEKQVEIGHEASVSRVGEEQLFYLMSRGLDEDAAIGMIVNGFIEPIVKELPMEYAVEMNRLIELQMEGSVG